MRSRVAAAVAAALALALLAGCGSGSGSPGSPGEVAIVSQPDSGPWQGSLVGSGYPLPEQTYTDTSGDAFTPATDASAPVTLVFLGYTSCPDVCNVVLANLAAALRASPAEVRDAVQVLFVATDPERDTAPVIREYLDRFDEDFVGLRAPTATVAETAQQLHLSYEPPPAGTKEAYEVEHATYTTAFVDGEALLVWSPETSVGDLKADLARLVQKAS